MNMQLALMFIEGIGLAILIGLGFFIIPFGLLIMCRMLPWFIYILLNKSQFIWRFFTKEPKCAFYQSSHNKKVYIYDCHPSQVIKHLIEDGLQSLFREYRSTCVPIHEPNNFSNESAPIDFLKSTNPKPINDKFKDSLNGFTHADNSSTANRGNQPNGNDT